MVVGSIRRSGGGVIFGVSIKLTPESELSLFPIGTGSSPEGELLLFHIGTGSSPEGELLFVGPADSATSQLPLMGPAGSATSELPRSPRTDISSSCHRVSGELHPYDELPPMVIGCAS